MSADPVAEPGAVMAAEIAEQPAALARLLADGLPGLRAVAAAVRERRPRCALLVARGTSDHAALYAKYLLEVRLGLPCGLVSPSTLTGYGARPELDGVLWLAVSQSGASPDLVESTRIAGERGALTVAVTNTAGSPLARAAAWHADVLAGPERAVAATKSYTSQLLALYLLVDAVAGGDGAAAARVPEVAADVLRREDADGLAARYRFVDRLVVTARGYAYPTAREAALKLMETGYVSAHAFSAADLLHGPLAMLDAGWPVVVVVPHGVGGRAVVPVLERLRERAADVLVVCDERVLPPAGRRWWAAQLTLPGELPEDLAPVVQIMPLQRLARRIALERGHDPDAPRSLQKLTRTH
jgi:glucosamine--fructose-6-phosphate aminotransferase (isomerizing)